MDANLKSRWVEMGLFQNERCYIISCDNTILADREWMMMQLEKLG